MYGYSPILQPLLLCLVRRAPFRAGSLGSGSPALPGVWNRLTQPCPICYNNRHGRTPNIWKTGTFSAVHRTNLSDFGPFGCIDDSRTLKAPSAALTGCRRTVSGEVVFINITERFPHESGRDYACRIIKENIIALELTPGCLVSEKELAQQLNLSRTPVREALIDLSKVGIVEVLPQRGSRISYIDYQMVNEAQFMRNALELAVCRRLCDDADLDGLAPLLANMKDQEACLARGDLQGFFHEDDRFHALLFQIGGLTHAHDLIDSFLVHFDRVRNLALRVTTPQQLLDDHKNLVYALLSHDDSLAAKIIELHLSRYRVDEAAIRQQYPDYLKPSID